MGKEGLIYLAQNKETGQIYVGQTVDFRVRLNHHRGGHAPSYFDRALKKHGEGKFRTCGLGTSKDRPGKKCYRRPGCLT